MKTHREKELEHLNDKRLINYLHTHLDRATDRNAGAQNNLLIATFDNLDELEQATYRLAARDYLIQQAEDLSAIRFALKHLHRRFLKHRRQVDNMERQFIKIRGEKPEQVEVYMPDIWNVDEPRGVSL